MMIALIITCLALIIFSSFFYSISRVLSRKLANTKNKMVNDSVEVIHRGEVVKKNNKKVIAEIENKRTLNNRKTIEINTLI